MKGYEHVIYLFLRMCHHITSQKPMVCRINPKSLLQCSPPDPLLLCTPDVDGWRMKDQFQNIFLSSDLDNDELKTLIHDCLYMTWLTGSFLSEFVPEWVGSYLISLEKPNGVIRDITPVNVWWRTTTVKDIVQTVQPLTVKVCIETYPNFKVQTTSFIKRWCVQLLITPKCCILWPVLYLNVEHGCPSGTAGRCLSSVLQVLNKVRRQWTLFFNILIYY